MLEGEATSCESTYQMRRMCRARRFSPLLGWGRAAHTKTGKPRTIIDIEKAAKVLTVETGTHPRFRRIETCAESPPAAETEVGGIDALKDTVLVLVTHNGGE